MKTTMDKQGRVVIPKAVRDQLGLQAGPIEIVVHGTEARLTPPATDALVERDGKLFVPDQGAALDVEELRELRYADQK